MSEQAKTEPGFFSDAVDGVAGLCMLKDDVTLNTFGKRFGVLAFGMGIGAVAHGRLAVKKGLAVLDDNARLRVINEIPLGSITIGK